MTSIFQLNLEFLRQVEHRVHDAIAEGSNELALRATVLTQKLATELSAKLSTDIISALIRFSLLAGLEREEGKFHSFSLIVEPPDGDELSPHFLFQRPIELNPINLAKLAPALDSTKYHVGVWFDETGQPQIWGFRSKLIWF